MRGIGFCIVCQGIEKNCEIELLDENYIFNINDKKTKTRIMPKFEFLDVLKVLLEIKSNWYIKSMYSLNQIGKINQYNIENKSEHNLELIYIWFKICSNIKILDNEVFKEAEKVLELVDFKVTKVRNRTEEMILEGKVIKMKDLFYVKKGNLFCEIYNNSELLTFGQHTWNTPVEFMCFYMIFGLNFRDKFKLEMRTRNLTFEQDCKKPWSYIYRYCCVFGNIVSLETERCYKNSLDTKNYVIELDN